MAEYPFIKKDLRFFKCRSFIKVAGPTRLELATSGVTGRHSNQLNYDPASKFKVQIRQSVVIALLRVYLANPFYSHFFRSDIKFFQTPEANQW